MNFFIILCLMCESAPLPICSRIFNIKNIGVFKVVYILQSLKLLFKIIFFFKYIYIDFKRLIE